MFKVKVKGYRYVFAIVFVVLSLVELGQFSYAQHEQQTKPDLVSSTTSTSRP